MPKLKLYVLASILWWFVFYNTERLVSPINLASFVYVLAPVYAALIILSPHINQRRLWWIALAGMVPFFILKATRGYEIGGMNMPLTVTEMASLFTTIFISWQIGRRIESLRAEILRLTIGSSSVAARPFQNAQAECYREIRRARHYNRPAALLSISPTKESMDLSINRFIQEAQTSIMRQYITARTADLLRSTLKETDVITMRNSHFLVLLPETTGDHLPSIINRLQDSAQDQLGLSLNVGVSTFPDDAITFESLVEQAEKRMDDVPPTKGDENKSALENGAPNPKELNKA
jgi:GGDEF domain-containing protein